MTQDWEQKRGGHGISWWILRFCQLSTVFPTSSLPPATACGQSVCGRPPGQLQRCSALIHEEQMTRPSATTLSFSGASFTMFSTSLSVSLYAIHARTSPPNSIHRHVLEPFALPRRVTAFTSRRAVHVCRNRDLIDRIELSLRASLNIFPELPLRAVSSDVVHPSGPTSPMLFVSQSSLVLKTSPTFPPYHSSEKRGGQGIACGRDSQPTSCVGRCRKHA